MINPTKKFRFPILLFLVFLLNGCTDLDDNLILAKEEDVIKIDSELFSLISQVTTPSNEPLEEIVCIDFIYPFKVFIYNSNLEPIGTKFLVGDDDFSTFLGTLPAGQSISISYPISTTLANGDVFSVNNNTELKLAIESCSREDIVAYCNGLFGGATGGTTNYVWKIPYIENGYNKYTSGIFVANGDGTLHFNFDNENYNGTWVFLFVNDVFQININLEGTSQVAQDWNINRDVVLSGNEIKIIDSTNSIILRKTFETSIIYEIGDTGPAGGIVFYDKGSYSLGWRYMEAAQNDLDFLEWGCNGSLISSADNPEIGRGFYNSAAIVNYHDNLLNYYTNPAVCNILNNGTVIAKKAILFTVNDYKDWFLPSNDELHLMYENLHLQTLGNFTNSIYWSSTGFDENNAKAIDFNNGSSILSPKIPVANTIKARAVRYF